MGVGEYVDNRESMATTLGECLERYLREITPAKKSAKVESYRIGLWLRHNLAKKPIGTIRSADIAKWRDAALENGKAPATVKLDLSVISHVFTIATKEWGMSLINPVRNVRMPKINNGRNRVLLSDEEHRIMDVASPEMRAIIIVALETAMRRSEILSMRREWINGNVITLPDTKNGTARRVPLSAKAIIAIASLPANIDGKVFSILSATAGIFFKGYCKKLGIENLHFHDLRHTATTNLFSKGLSVMEVQSINWIHHSQHTSFSHAWHSGFC